MLNNFIFHLPLLLDFFEDKEQDLHNLILDTNLIQQLDNEDKKIIHSNIIVNDTLCYKELRKILIGFSYDNKIKNYPKKSSFLCYWCCHTFETIPCFIPLSYEKDKKYFFKVHGNFCSFNCAKTYIIENREINWNKQLELLNFLYRLIYKEDITINPAPSKYLLKIFGGFMEIDEFRSTFNLNTNYNLIYPDMISIIPQIESETPIKYIKDENVEQKKLQEFLIKKTTKKYKQTSIF